MRHAYLLLLPVLLLAACESPSNVGATCVLSAPGSSGDGVTIESPAIECSARTCLRVESSAASSGPGTSAPDPELGHCTDLCESDDDCAGAVDDDCAGGYTCAVPTVTGAFCCLSMCVCRDDLAALPQQPTPAACLVSDPANQCQNLPGREGS